jgi:hypothetical protein
MIQSQSAAASKTASRGDAVVDYLSRAAMSASARPRSARQVGCRNAGVDYDDPALLCGVKLTGTTWEVHSTFQYNFC